ncbi:MAG: hypothetical protein RR382_00620 [Tannerellaceae bacterium]
MKTTTTTENETNEVPAAVRVTAKLFTSYTDRQYKYMDNHTDLPALRKGYTLCAAVSMFVAAAAVAFALVLYLILPTCTGFDDINTWRLTLVCGFGLTISGLAFIYVNKERMAGQILQERECSEKNNDEDKEEVAE